MAWPGEQAAWDVLAGLEARDITARAEAAFNSGGSTYTLRRVSTQGVSFVGLQLCLAPGNRCHLVNRHDGR